MEKKLSSKYIHMYMSISRVFIRLTGNLKADGIPVSLDSYQPATQAYALSRGVAYLNDIRGFPDAAFYEQYERNYCR